MIGSRADVHLVPDDALAALLDTLGGVCEVCGFSLWGGLKEISS